MNSDNAVIAAQRQIASILAALERETGQLVDAISVTKIEVTSGADVVPRHKMSVGIELVRLPGHEW